MFETLEDEDGCTAWRPGVGSGIPRAFRDLETIFRPDHAATAADDVADIARLTGLQPEDLTEFRPSRLALHELIVRVTADIVVPEGETEEALGNGFRQVVHAIWSNYLLPQIGEIETTYARLHDEVSAMMSRILEESLFHPDASSPKRSFFGILLPFPRQRENAAETQAEREHRMIVGFKNAGLQATEALPQAVYRSLYRVLGAILATQGRLGANSELLASLATRDVCNRFGSQLIGEQVGPLVNRAINDRGYALVKPQTAPILISLKGASAAGKSSLRPMLREILQERGIASDGYATISPDIWRRVLLDYGALGPARKYAGHLTSREVAVIDAKLDRYIRDKAERQHALPHLMIDRFRFDSFSAAQVPRALHATYAKHVASMYMYFIVTPPEATVERGWRRALERGRYKAVEDFLGHCVEAYCGIPRVFFKWMESARPDYHYYFLDNQVLKGTFPKICAVGGRDAMVIYDPLVFVNIERYQKINIHATSSEDVYPPAASLALGDNLNFLEQCLRRIPVVTLADRTSGKEYLRIAKQKVAIVDPRQLSLAKCNPEVAELIDRLVQR